MRRLLAAVAVAAAGLVATVSPAAADGIAIRKVDTSAFPEVRVEVAGAANGGQLTVTEDGRSVVPTSVLPAARDGAAIVLVVDTSAAMAPEGRAAQVRAMASRLVASRKAGDSIGIVAAGDPATVLQAPTTDATALQRAIDALGSAGTSHRDDAVRLGAGLLAGKEGTLVVVSASKDVGSTGTFDEARSTALASHASILAVGISADGLDRAGLQALAAATAGAYHEVNDALALPTVADDVRADLAGRWTVTYRSGATQPFSVTVAAGLQSVTATNVVPGQRAGTGVKTSKPTASVGPLRHSIGLVIITFLVLLAAAAMFGAVAMLAMPASNVLDQTLEAYDLERGRPEDADRDESLVKTAIVQRAVALTEQVASRRDVLASVERKLDQADIKLRAAEVLFFSVVAVGLVALLGFTLLQPIVALLLVLFSAYLPVGILTFLAARRRRKFVSQLPDMLNLLAATLRSGYALLQGLSAIVGEVADPMGSELRKVLIEAQLGRDLDEAMEDCATRMQSPDFEWAVMAIGIQREVGGNLAELLDTVADTMLARERLRREVAALTAEGKMSAIVLGAMPPGLAAVMFVLNRGYIEPLFTETLGNMMLGAAAVWAVFGFWWMKKTITIEI